MSGLETKRRPAAPSLELGRYMTESGERRRLVGQISEDGQLSLYDVPFPGQCGGSVYYVESGFESRAELAIFRRRYLEHAERLGDSPMSPAAIDEIVEPRIDRTR